jgi:hypothetical protein
MAAVPTPPPHCTGPCLACMCLATDLASSCLCAHYNAALVHTRCEAWDDALDSLGACLMVPCSAVGLLAAAARKNGLLVQCLLVGGKELDGGRGGGTATTGGGGAAAPCANCGGGPGRRMAGLSMKGRVLGLLGAASTAIIKFTLALSSRVCRAESAIRGGGASSLSMPERRAGRSKTSLPPTGPPRRCRCCHPLPAVVADPPTHVLHAIVKGGNPPINSASIAGGCKVAIVVAPNIDDVSIPWEDGIANGHCRAVAAAAHR